MTLSDNRPTLLQHDPTARAALEHEHVELRHVAWYIETTEALTLIELVRVHGTLGFFCRDTSRDLERDAALPARHVLVKTIPLARVPSVVSSFRLELTGETLSHCNEHTARLERAWVAWTAGLPDAVTYNLMLDSLEALWQRAGITSRSARTSRLGASQHFETETLLERGYAMVNEPTDPGAYLI